MIFEKITSELVNYGHESAVTFCRLLENGSTPRGPPLMAMFCHVADQLANEFDLKVNCI